MLKGFFSALKDMFSGSSKVSSTRVITVSVVWTIVGVFFAHNIASIIRNTGFIDFPLNSVGVLGLILSAKVGQHVSEMQAKPKDIQENPGSAPEDK